MIHYKNFLLFFFLSVLIFFEKILNFFSLHERVKNNKQIVNPQCNNFRHVEVNRKRFRSKTNDETTQGKCIGVRVHPNLSSRTAKTGVKPGGKSKADSRRLGFKERKELNILNSDALAKLLRFARKLQIASIVSLNTILKHFPNKSCF